MVKLLFFLVILPATSFSQRDTLPKNSSGRYELTEVVKAENSSAEDLYSNAKKFIALKFKSGKEVTQLNDENSKTVVGKGSMTVKLKISIGSPVYSPVDYTFTISCKDNKYRYSITDFLFYNTGDLRTTKELEDERYWTKNRETKKWWPDVKQQIFEEVNGLVILLKKSMNENKDW